jgi:uncharacterized protein YcsI (UPF0317 family)
VRTGSKARVIEMNAGGTSSLSKRDVEHLSPGDLRALIRAGSFKGSSEGLAKAYAQANLVVLPKEYAFEFVLFCLRNPKPCPLVEVLDPGDPRVKLSARDADIRTDLSRYCVYRNGKLVDEPADITAYWRDDLVGFLIGCSYSFETALINAGIPLRHQQENKIVSLYVTNIQCNEAGRFHGPMVVSMRPVKHSQVVRAVQVTSRFPATHGAPIHIGDPAAIGVDLDDVALGSARIEVKADEVPVFWGCGCTPQTAALASKPELMITHKAGFLFVTDMLSEEIAAL